MLGVGFEPTHPKILELESSALDRSAIQAIEVKPKWGTICEFVLKCFVFLYFSEKKKWSIRVSIPVPRACKARTLPIELMPQKIIPGGTWTPNLLIRSQTPCPIGPQGLYNMWPLRLSTLLILKLILGPKKGCCRNRTSDRRICNPMLYRWAKHPWSRYAKVEPSYFFFNILAQNQWKKRQRGRAGIEPATSRTRSENHTTRPTARNNSLRLLWLMEKKCRWLRSGSATPTL